MADVSYRGRSGDSKFPDASFPFKNDFDTETLGFTPRYVWQGAVFDRTNKLIAGVDLYHTQQDNKSTRASSRRCPPRRPASRT